MRNLIERHRASEKGFTLIELLVVIVILGILAAVVVFAVGGLNDKGGTSACKTDTRTLRTAEEAHFAKAPTGGTYATEQGLVDADLLSELSTLHNITLVPADPDGADGIAGNADDIPRDTYNITVQSTGDCGTAGGVVGTGSNI